MKILLSDLQIISTLFFLEDSKIKARVRQQDMIQDEVQLFYTPNIEIINENIDLKDLVSEQVDAIIDFSNKHDSIDGYEAFKFNYIAHSTGAIKWFFPVSLAAPTFLNFLNPNSNNGNFSASKLKFAFQTPFRKFFIKDSFTIYSKNSLSFERFSLATPFENYSVFTSKNGTDRRLVLELNTQGKTTHFLKIALNKTSVKLLENEIYKIKWVSELKLNYSILPTVKRGKTFAVFTNIKPEKVDKVIKIDKIHLMALHEFYIYTSTKVTVGSLPLVIKAREVLPNLKPRKELSESTHIIELLNALNMSLDDNLRIPTALAHADFTPWNMYISNNKLYAYDWEDSADSVPMLFDLFHFIFKSEIFYKSGYPKIKSEINRALSLHPALDLIVNQKISTSVQYKLYIFCEISLHMNVLQNKETIGEFERRCTRIWHKALTDMHQV